ncbi:MAG: 2-oxoacid:acceptor oxidoreductase subunit alpha [Desulfobacterales bacterium]|nr:2-oxoacid:acceptor oxidoreductase subunit alpha [Desulfobacterales bacterium]
MNIDITVKIGGEAGQGIQSVGQILSFVCQKAGLYVFGINDYESRIRGGHSFFQLRISDKPINAPNNVVNLLVSLDKRTYEIHKNELSINAISVIDSEDLHFNDGILSLPIMKEAIKAGGSQTANIVAAGACLSLLKTPFEFLEEAVHEIFGRKKEMLESNIAAAKIGFQMASSVQFNYAFKWDKNSSKGIIMEGSKAIALGALASDCRFAAFYPMSPATGIMTHLSSFASAYKIPLVVEQAEDELSAINMIIGASFAGVRSMTSTSGGGFCLMTEGLGLAAITETPIVIVNAQRPGPATGLPTRTAQADLLFVIRASQDEFPRFVFAPGTPKEAFDTIIKAFHLSEKYQVPSIVLSDHHFNSSMFLVEEPLNVPPTIERFLAKDEDLENINEYKRFLLTPDGVSKRALPCMGKALVVVSGNEHSEDGHVSEAAQNRINMVNKRNAKLVSMQKEISSPESYYGDSEILIIGWGATKPAIQESINILRKNGINVGSLHFKDLWPFPLEFSEKILKNSKKFFVAEENSTAQLGQLIKEQTGLSYSGAILKYDGRPFFPIEIVNKLTDFLKV